jgi:hypothetical protein
VAREGTRSRRDVQIAGDVVTRWAEQEWAGHVSMPPIQPGTNQGTNTAPAPQVPTDL